MKSSEIQTKSNEIQTKSNEIQRNPGTGQAQARHSPPLHSAFLFEIGAGQTIQSGESIHFLIENENGRPSKLGGARRANPPASKIKCIKILKLSA